MKYLIFDGPGLKSPQRKKQNGLTILRMKSFQCIAQIVNLNTTGVIDDALNFKSQNLSAMIFQIKKFGPEYTIMYPEKYCSSNVACILHLIVPLGSYLNVTMDELYYEGEAEARCLHWGIALFDRSSDNTPFSETLLESCAINMVYPNIICLLDITFL